MPIRSRIDFGVVDCDLLRDLQEFFAHGLTVGLEGGEVFEFIFFE
jgi:hypothetical protein